MRLLCGVACHVAFNRTESPPPQTKTLRIQIVFLYRAALVFQTWEGDTKLFYEFKFSYRVTLEHKKTFARDLVFYDMRRFFDSVYLCML